MKLLALEARSVRGLTDGVFDLASAEGPRARLAVTGPPGSGMTSFLHAVAATAAGLASRASTLRDHDVIRVGHDAASVHSTWQLDEEEQREGGLRHGRVEARVTFRMGAPHRAEADPALLAAMSRYDHSGTSSKVVFLPERRSFQGGGVGLGDFVADMRRLQLSPDGTKVAGFERALFDDARSPRSRGLFERTKALFDEAVESSKLARGPAGIELTSRRGSVPLALASSSERHAFVLAAAPALLGLGKAVVLLDQPELGLDPAVAIQLLERGFEASPDSQWIVATRNPALLASAGLAGAIDLGRLRG